MTGRNGSRQRTGSQLQPARWRDPLRPSAGLLRRPSPPNREAFTARAQRDPLFSVTLW